MRKKKHQVVIQIEPSGDRQTHLVLTSLGFGTGKQWTDVHAYFEEAWDAVLGRLKASFE